MLQLSDKIKYTSNKKANTHSHNTNISFEEIPQHISIYQKFDLDTLWEVDERFAVFLKYVPNF